MYNQIIQSIQNAKTIYLYRHINPDYDALGCVYGLATWIKDNFKDKELIIMGEINDELYTMMQLDKTQKQFVKKPQSLAIVLDTATKQRIDGEGYDLCDTLIKIDHHIEVDAYGEFRYVDASASSASELVGRMALAYEEYPLSCQAATYLYYGMVGDTNRFMYEATTASTFEVAAYLTKQGIDLPAIYESMYLQEKVARDVTAWILNHYKQVGQFAYYVLHQDDLDALNISREVGSNFVHTLQNYKDIEVWAAITYQKEKDNYRVSLRSRHVPVEPIAREFNGGGHIYAAGATLARIEDLDHMTTMILEAISHEISN